MGVRIKFMIWGKWPAPISVNVLCFIQKYMEKCNSLTRKQLIMLCFFKKKKKGEKKKKNSINKFKNFNYKIRFLE